MPAPAAPRARTGPRCCCACTRAGPSSTATRSSITRRREGEEAGHQVRDAEINGPNAYGWLKTEDGVHRLVRISPFDSNARRHTSFASVWVYPVVDDRINIDINESDVRTDTLRVEAPAASTSTRPNSAVRLTHIPTGIAVPARPSARSTRTAPPRGDAARRLYEQELKKREAQAAAEQAAKTDIGWGHQIRSYVLQPYQMVKDLRTGVETTNTGAVLDGDLDQFMEAVLAQKAFGKGPVEVEDVE